MTPPGVGGVSAYFSIQSTRRKSSAAKLEAMRIYNRVIYSTSPKRVTIKTPSRVHPAR